MSRRRFLALATACTAAFTFSVSAQADTVKIGVLGTFSGPFARFGEQMKHGIEAFQVHNGASVNGHKVEIVYRDVGGVDPQRARQLAEELVLREKVQAIGGFVFTPNALSVAEVLNEAKIPGVLFNAATSVIPRKSPYFVRTSFTLAQDTVPLAQWAAKNGIKKVVTLIADYGPGYDGEEAFTRTFKAAGGEIVESIRVPLATTDFSPFYERVLARKPDALFMFGPGGPPSIGMINTWAARLKPAGIKLLATNETQEIDLPKIGPSAIDVISAAHYTETIDTPLNLQLRKTLVEKYGKDSVPDTELVGAYDGMRLIYAAVQKFGPRFTGDQAMSLFKGMKFDSPRGPVQIDPATRDIVQNVYIRRVQQRDGKLVNVNFDTIPMVKDPWKEWNPEGGSAAK
jgi:branched-chain amino acid transport system substrate-binding protein